MKILFFINVLLSIANANYGSDGFKNEVNLERRSNTGLYEVMFKPYVLELMNSKAVGALKRTNCYLNLHFLLTKTDLHYMASLPISRALFTKRIPQFQEWLLNLKKGPSAAKGTLITFSLFGKTDRFEEVTLKIVNI